MQMLTYAHFRRRQAEGENYAAEVGEYAEMVDDNVQMREECMDEMTGEGKENTCILVHLCRCIAIGCDSLCLSCIL